MPWSDFTQTLFHWFRFRFDVGYRIKLELVEFERWKVEELNRRIEECNDMLIKSFSAGGS